MKSTALYYLDRVQVHNAFSKKLKSSKTLSPLELESRLGQSFENVLVDRNFSEWKKKIERNL